MALSVTPEKFFDQGGSVFIFCTWSWIHSMLTTK
jgi:hypothetical protein